MNYSDLTAIMLINIILDSIHKVWFLQIYIIGNTLKLGQWNVQNGLKLSYSGESIWHADCVLPKGDFPIKYPC